MALRLRRVFVNGASVSAVRLQSHNANLLFMNKIGKIKSWYIDPDDNRLTYTQHNILFVNILGGEKFYTIRHDSVEFDDYDAAVELGTFDLRGNTFNARFADIYSRMNYTNVTL